MLQYLYASVLVLTLVLTAWSNMGVRAQAVLCGPHEVMLAKLKQQYGEDIVVSGVTSVGWMFELLENTVTTTWTVLVASPRGQACVLSSGDGLRYHVIHPEEEEEIRDADVH